MNNSNSVMVTGASGFIGRVLCKELLLKHYKLSILLRGHDTLASIDSNIVSNSEIFSYDNDNDFSMLLMDVDIVIHLAARVHMVHETENDPLKVYREANVELTKKLALAAVANKVKRFIFISSLLVNDGNFGSTPLLETDIPSPQTPYGISKLEAEEILREISAQYGLEVVIIRPPLVYGPHVKGNFLSLLRLVNVGLPFLPLGALNNKRSFVSVNNLVDLLIACIEHPKASNEVFFVSDDEDVSVTNLIKLLAKHLDKPRPLLPISVGLLEKIGKLLGKLDSVKKLSMPLQVNITKVKNLLGWRPVQELSDGLQEMVDWFRE